MRKLLFFSLFSYSSFFSSVNSMNLIPFARAESEGAQVSTEAVKTTGGRLLVAGSGCPNQTIAELNPIELGGTRYRIPVALKFAKKKSSPLDRKICNFSLAIKVGKNQKIQVSDLSQKIEMKSSADLPLKYSVAIFSSMVSAGNPLTVENKTAETFMRELKTDGVLFETECGRDAIIRGNTNVFAQGAGSASAETGAVHLTMKILSCR